MILLYVLLVFCLLGTLVATVLRDWLERQTRWPAAAEQKDPLPPVASHNGVAAQGAKKVIGLSAHVQVDGVHLRFYLPPNRWGISSPITRLVSTRQRDEDGSHTLYAMTTESDSLYLVAMTDDTAKQVLRTFYDWQNGAGVPVRPDGARAESLLPLSGREDTAADGRACDHDRDQVVPPRPGQRPGCS
jgi:hypothetical protein